MDRQHLMHWNARRAGGRITVTGTNADGREVKIVGVDKIVPGPPGSGHCIAVDKNDADHRLDI